MFAWYIGLPTNARQIDIRCFGNMIVQIPEYAHTTIVTRPRLYQGQTEDVVLKLCHFPGNLVFVRGLIRQNWRSLFVW